MEILSLADDNERVIVCIVAKEKFFNIFIFFVLCMHCKPISILHKHFIAGIKEIFVHHILGT